MSDMEVLVASVVIGIAVTAAIAAGKALHRHIRMQRWLKRLDCAELAEERRKWR